SVRLSSRAPAVIRHPREGGDPVLHGPAKSQNWMSAASTMKTLVQAASGKLWSLAALPPLPARGLRRDGSDSRRMRRQVLRLWRRNEPVLYGRPYFSQTARTSGAISA